MSITADILPAYAGAPVARTRLHVDGVPGGAEWRVIGQAGGHEWVAAHEVSTGSGRWLTDPMAPLGMEAVYELRYGSVVESSVPVSRPAAGSDLVTSLDGRTVARVARMADGGDAWSWGASLALLDIPGSAPVARYGQPSAPTGGMVAHTSGHDTRTLAAMVAAGGPLVVLHDQSVCEIDGCDIAPGLRVSLTGHDAERTGRVDIAERSWSLSWSEARPPWRYTAPVATWADVHRHFGTVGAVRASGLTHEQVAAGDWLSW